MNNEHVIDACLASPLGQDPLACFLAAHGTRLPTDCPSGAPHAALRNACDSSLSGGLQYWVGDARHPADVTPDLALELARQCQ